uniref:Uncharacterized protein n=1 Tax=Helianthus annuus TaxID=4232 RepID=A0A251SNV9_HELAN
MASLPRYEIGFLPLGSQIFDSVLKASSPSVRLRHQINITSYGYELSLTGLIDTNSRVREGGDRLVKNTCTRRFCFSSDLQHGKVRKRVSISCSVLR